MAENARTPAIRFAEFSDIWEQCKLGEIVNIKSGMSPSTFKAGSDLYVKVDDLNYSFREQCDSQMKVAEKSKCTKVKKGSIVFPKRGAAIMTNKVRIMGASGYMDTNMMALEPEGINNEFLYLFINKTGLYKIADTSTIPQINNKHIEPYDIIMPSIAEQQKIGEYFRNLENLITLHQRKYDKLVTVKKAMLEKMFPKNGSSFPEIRFAGFTEAWEQRKLGELIRFSKGTGYSKADLKEFGTPLILYGRLYTKYETVITEVDTFADAKPTSVYSQGGEVIVPASGETAEDISIASVVEKSGVLLGGDLNIITPPDCIDSAFLAISISNGKPHDDMAKMAQGKSVVHLHNADLEKINLLFPNYTEQIKISGYFKQTDALITLHQRKLVKLKNLKKAFLEKMFV
jgi:type I restriction enzyme, S subunit